MRREGEGEGGGGGGRAGFPAPIRDEGKGGQGFQLAMGVTPPPGPPTTSTKPPPLLACLQYGWGVLASVVGEAHHLDHHVKPRREKRPGIDAPWYITVPLWRAVGLVGPANKVVPPAE